TTALPTRFTSSCSLHRRSRSPARWVRRPIRWRSSNQRQRREIPFLLLPERFTMLGHNRKMSGAECLADMLKGYGVTHVFHVPAVLRKTMAGVEGRTDLKRLHVHGEKAAAYMGDGYARASGKPGICAAQVIGALNLAAGLRDAWLAHSPVIAMTGGRDPKTKFRKVYQEIDDVPAFEPVTKFNATVDDVA